jgi:hypothetical protein
VGLSNKGEGRTMLVLRFVYFGKWSPCGFESLTVSGKYFGTMYLVLYV